MRNFWIVLAVLWSVNLSVGETRGQSFELFREVPEFDVFEPGKTLKAAAVDRRSLVAIEGLFAPKFELFPESLDWMIAGKPTVIVYSIENCGPCKRLKRDAELLPFALEFRQPPGWVSALPTFHWQSADGKWWQSPGYISRDVIEKTWRNTQPVRPGDS